MDPFTITNIERGEDTFLVITFLVQMIWMLILNATGRCFLWTQAALLTSPLSQNLDFHILADQFVDLFFLVTETQLEELKSVFPNEVAFFLEHGERLTALIVKQEFTQDGSENHEALSELVEILRGQNMQEFLSVLSQTSGSRCSSVSSLLPEFDMGEYPSHLDVPKLMHPATSSRLNSPEWFGCNQECSDGSDSGEDLQQRLPVPSLPLKEFPEELVININTSLTGLTPTTTPLSASKVQVDHHSAVAAFEEWAELQSPL